MDPRSEPPFNPIPPVVAALALVIIGVEIVFFLGTKGMIGGPQAVGWRLDAAQQFGFIDAVFDWMLVNRTAPVEHLIRFVTYPMIQTGFTHAVFVAVFILAIGKMVGEVFHPLAVLAIFFLSAAVGALVWGLVLSEQAALLGGYPGVYGLIGAFTFLMWAHLTITGGNRLQAFQLIGILLAIQLVFGIAFGGNNDWVAEVAGFATGFVLSFVVSPGGWQRVMARLRNR